MYERNFYVSFLKNYEIKPLIESNDYASIKENLKFKNTAKKNQNCTDDYKIYKDKISKSIKKLEKLTRFENIEELKKLLWMSNNILI